jgi:pimeloyl-ACP methyl ester carboxylesterase
MLLRKYIPLSGLICFIFLTACSQTPTARLQQETSKLEAELFYNTDNYPQAIVYKEKNESFQSRSLHLYIGGDGLPMLNGGTVAAADPTVFDDVLFPLFAMDKAEKAFVGRPCYYRESYDRRCQSTLWTTGRYSEAVITAMQVQIEQLQRRSKADSLVLVGYSGGAAIAVLLSSRLADVKAVVSIAGNVDTNAWLALHGYSPLDASLNPLEYLRDDIPYWLFVGSADDNVSRSTYGAITEQANIELRIVDDFTHHCCWQTVWPDVLQKLQHLE